MMDDRVSDDCLPTEALEAVLALESDDPRRQHLDRCPRCRTLARAYQSFMLGPVEASDPDVDARLRSFLSGAVAADPGAGASLHAAVPRQEHGIAGVAGIAGQGAPADVTRRLARWLSDAVRASLRPPVLARALPAALLVLVGLVTVHPWDRASSPRDPRDVVLRGRPPAAEGVAIELLPPVRLAGGAIRLRWTPVPAADGHRVLIIGEGLAEIARIPSSSGNELLLEPDHLDALRASSSRLIWRVQALEGGDVIAESRPAALIESGDQAP